MKQPLFRFWLFNSSILFYLLHSNATTAQIVPDATLPVNSSVTQRGNTSIIEGGTTAGTNLFHSFKEFSVPNGAEAFFNNALDIQNIFSRVTGGNISNIDGLIRANGVANLFLINPNGIIFGPNARLNIGGSFLASTASSIRFADGMDFSATNTNAPPLLTINVPIGLQYGKNAGEIRVKGNGQEFGLDGATESFESSLNPLEVLPGKTLAIAGGNIIIDGGILQAPGGRVELGAVSGEGTIGINADGSLSFPDGVARKDVAITNKAGINVLGGGGGSIAIIGRNIDISEESLLTGGIATGQGIPESMAGEISLSATEAITMELSLLENSVNPDAIGNRGSININAKSLFVTNGAQLSASTFGQGKGGNMTIKATDTIEVIGTSADGQFYSLLRASAFPNSTGDGGDLTIETGRLILLNGGQISVDTFGQGKAGNMAIKATDAIQVMGTSADGSGPSAISASASPGATGDGGNLIIETRRLMIGDGAQIRSVTFGPGKGGTLTVKATDSVELIGTAKIGSKIDGRGSSSLAASSQSGSTGNAGDLTIETRRLILRDGARIGASTFGQGKGGTILVKATDSIELIDTDIAGPFRSGLGSTASPDSTGDAGNAIIETGRLTIRGGGSITTKTYGPGKGGTLTIQATDSVELIGTSADDQKRSGLFTSAELGSTGVAGDLIVETGQLIVRDEAEVRVNSLGEGKAGTLRITADSIELSNKGSLDANTKAGGGSIQLQAPTISLRNSSITTNATGGDKGGDIIIGSQFLQLRDNSTITTNAQGIEVNGGNIKLNTDILAALENSDITANAQEGKGGEITINADAIFGSVARTREEIQLLLNTKDANSIDPRQLLTSDITAISQQGGPQFQGTITVNTPDVDPSSGLIELPVDFVDPTRLIAQGCPANRGNSFTVTGRGGLPPSPNDPLRPNNTVSVNWVTRDRESRGSLEQVSKGANEQGAEIIEATGWIVNEKGQVVLIASRPNTTPNRLLSTTPSCPETVEAR